MLTRKSIDTVLLSVGAEKLSQREWDWMKMLKPMDPPPAMVAASILERRQRPEHCDDDLCRRTNHV
ncbi:IS1294 transposase [Shigella sonnei]|uniref:hypothetical protein n=1 Tax=Shigella sonnei TaxID=624 RepID=UPI000E2DF8BC|nr:hypothetical protein [Shigella sonnei]SVG33922.1 IS1294 transposase [Shigella sonnei]